MTITEKSLRNKIIEALKSQGFHINPHLRAGETNKVEKNIIKKFTRKKDENN